MTRLRVLRRVIAALGVLLVALTACQGTARPARSLAGHPPLEFNAPQRTIAPDFLGVNGESINTDLAGEVWRDKGFAATVAALRPGNIRIFGGTSANLWNWRDGRLARSGPAGTTGYLAGDPASPISVSELAGVTQAAGATGVVDLNMISSTLGDQIAAIAALEKAGTTVRRVELGNELWAPAYRRFFKDGAAYAQVANTWISSLHRAFPGIQVAVDAIDPESAGDERAEAWNGQLFAGVHGAAAAILHTYLSAPSADPGQTVSAPSRQWSPLILSALRTIPRHLPVWVTEWNYAPTTSGNTTWARALGDTLFALRLLTSPRVGLADFHALVGATGSSFAAVWASPGRSPSDVLRYHLSSSGVALRMLFRAFDGCKVVRSVHVPSAVGAAGVACLTAGMKGVLLVNPTSRSLVVDASAVAGSGDHSSTSVAENPTGTTAPGSSFRESTDVGAILIPAWGVVTING